MSSVETKKGRFFNVNHYTWILLVVWTLVVAGLLIKEVLDVRQATQTTASNTARAHLNKDKSFRFWGTAHGGIYVPVNENTPPNPYLTHIPDRDITTPSGKHLTLMNPEYMVRHLNETFSELYGVAGHITSLKPLRPANGPDDWESKALLAFEQGAKEVLEFTTDKDGKPLLRLMQPLMVTPGCLKCHGHQGYKAGDVRGGVGISLPMAPFLAHANQQLTLHTVSLVLLWCLGVAGLSLGSSRLNRRTAELATSNIELSHEIEERKRAEDALKKESTFTGAILDTAGALVMVLDDQGRIIRFNRTCEQLTGYTFNEIRGQIFWDLLLLPTEAERLRKAFAELQSRPFPVKYENQLRTQAGTRRVIDWSNTTFRSADGSIEYVICIGIDITERNQLHQQLLHAEKLSAVGKLSASIAHEINNPLFGIRNVLERLKEKANLDPDNMEFAILAIQECNRIKNLIKDLQDFNRPTSGIATAMRLHQAINDMLLLSRKEMEVKRITVVKNFDPKLADIHAIADQIKQVLLNLITNAIEAISQQGTLTITTASNGHEVTIGIDDTGAGIAPDDMNHIFEPFFTTKPAVKGTGLGLSITYGIIKRHGGEIAVRSEVGKGTTFTITLPIEGVLT